MRRFPQLHRLAIYALPLALLLTAAAARILAPDLSGRLSLIAFDFYQRMAPRAPTNSPVAIVDIDDNSLAAIGQWPWPRTIIAELVEKLAKAGAAVIAFDIDFAEPDRTSPKMLLPLLVRNGAGARQAGELLDALPDPDARLAQAMRTVPVVTGFILTDRGSARPPAAKAGFAFAGDHPLGHVADYPTAIANLPILEAAAAGDGFLNQYVDWDHVVRRVPLILTLGGKPYPSLAAEALRVAFGCIDLCRARCRGERRAGFWQGHRFDGDPHRAADRADRRRRPSVAALPGASAGARDRRCRHSRRQVRSGANRRPYRPRRHLGRRGDQRSAGDADRPERSRGRDPRSAPRPDPRAIVPQSSRLGGRRRDPVHLVDRCPC